MIEINLSLGFLILSNCVIIGLMHQHTRKEYPNIPMVKFFKLTLFQTHLIDFSIVMFILFFLLPFIYGVQHFFNNFIYDFLSGLAVTIVYLIRAND